MSQYLLDGAAVVTALLVLWGAIVKLLIPIYVWAKKIKCHFRKMIELPEKVDRIVKEVSPNSGTSMKDVVNRIEFRQILHEQKAHAYVSHAPVAFYETDVNGDCNWVNKAYLRLLEKSEDEVLGKGWITALHPEDKVQTVAIWESSIVDKREFSHDYRMISSSGKIIALHGEAFPLRDPSGKVLGYVGTIQTQPA